MGQALNIEKYVEAYVEHKAAASNQHLDARTMEIIHRGVAVDVLNAVYPLIEADVRDKIEADRG